MEEDDDDVIMQLEADEGLLPSLTDFYDAISADTIPPEELLADAVIAEAENSSHIVPPESSDSFLVEEEKPVTPSKSPSNGPKPPAASDDRTRVFQETLQKLTESMKRSQETRQSLYAKTPKLRDYKRIGSVKKVLRSIEFSSCQILRATTVQ